MKPPPRLVIYLGGLWYRRWRDCWLGPFTTRKAALS